VKSHQDEKSDLADLTRPAQLNVLADRRATAALDELHAARKLQSSTHYLPAEATFVTPLGISPAAKYARLEPNYPSTSFELTSKNAMAGQTTSTIPSAGRPTGQPMPDSLTVSGHSRSNLVMAGYPSAYAKDNAALRLTSALTASSGHRGAIGF
jgi:hypothetical protein